MKRLFILLFALLPMLLSAQNLVPKKHPKKDLYGYWGEKKNGKEGFVIKPKFENADPFAGDYAFVCYKGLWGIIGKDGKFVVEPKYDKASEPRNGVTIVSLGGKYGLVKDGKIIVETKYKEVLYLQNNTFAVYSNKLEFANSEGKVVGQPNNVLLYTSNNGKTIDRGGCIGKIVSNTYHNGQGMMVFDKPITSIGEEAFCGCDGLTSITIPNSVTEIGAWAFWGCYGLTCITLPNSVTSIGEKAFYYCTSLTSVTIPNSVTSIGEVAFAGSGLTRVTIPNSVTEIGSNAFYGCDGLTSITIPSSVTSIESSAFYDCDRLTRVNVNISDLAKYCTSNPTHSIRGKKHLYLNGKEITNLVIPNSVTSIGHWAFRNCDGLTSITIPDSVTEIGDNAFIDCCGLTSITIPNSVTEIGEWAFEGCKSLTSIAIPNSVTSIGKSAFSGCSSLKSVTIGKGIEEIDNYAFYGCTSLKAVYLNATIPPYLGEEVFDYDAGRICCPIYVPSSSLSKYKGVGGNWWDYYRYLCGR